MVVDKKVITYPSVTCLADINARSWTPRRKTSVKAVIQIAHGMAEHIERYDEFARFIASHGFAVYANDHIGHGDSIASDFDLGYFGEDNLKGNAFVDDCKKLQDIAKEKYPDVPYFFFGHSMGSFIARKFAAKYGETLKGAIFCGTAPKNPAAPVGIALAEKIAKYKGDHYRSKFLNDLNFNGFNKYTEKMTSVDWLTRDRRIVDEYIADNKCGFLFTAVGYRDLYSLLDDVSKDNWYHNIPRNLNIMMIAGSMDPVGKYGKGVQDVASKLRQLGRKVEDKIYLYDRHEILNELDKEEVYEDVLNWIMKITTEE